MVGKSCGGVRDHACQVLLIPALLFIRLVTSWPRCFLVYVPPWSFSLAVGGLEPALAAAAHDPQLVADHAVTENPLSSAYNSLSVTFDDPSPEAASLFHSPGQPGYLVLKHVRCACLLCMPNNQLQVATLLQLRASSTASLRTVASTYCTVSVGPYTYAKGCTRGEGWCGLVLQDGCVCQVCMQTLTAATARSTHA